MIIPNRCYRQQPVRLVPRITTPASNGNPRNLWLFILLGWKSNPAFRYACQALRQIRIGEVAEWSKAAVLKTVEAQASVGSNPTLSAIHAKRGLAPLFSWIIDSGFEPTDIKWPGSSRASRSDVRQRPQAGPEGARAKGPSHPTLSAIHAKRWLVPLFSWMAALADPTIRRVPVLEVFKRACRNHRIKANAYVYL
jgi:hypothetical protein